MKFNIKNKYGISIESGKVQISKYLAGSSEEISIDQVFMITDTLVYENDWKVYANSHGVICKYDGGSLEIDFNKFVYESLGGVGYVRQSTLLELARLYESFKLYMMTMSVGTMIKFANGIGGLLKFGNLEIYSGDHSILPKSNMMTSDFVENVKKYITVDSEFYTYDNYMYLVNPDCVIRVWTLGYVKLPYMFISDLKIESNKDRFMDYLYGFVEYVKR